MRSREFQFGAAEASACRRTKKCGRDSRWESRREGYGKAPMPSYGGPVRPHGNLGGRFAG